MIYVGTRGISRGAMGALAEAHGNSMGIYVGIRVGPPVSIAFQPGMVGTSAHGSNAVDCVCGLPRGLP